VAARSGREPEASGYVESLGKAVGLLALLLPLIGALMRAYSFQIAGVVPPFEIALAASVQQLSAIGFLALLPSTAGWFFAVLSLRRYSSFLVSCAEVEKLLRQTVERHKAGLEARLKALEKELAEIDRLAPEDTGRIPPELQERLNALRDDIKVIETKTDDAAQEVGEVREAYDRAEALAPPIHKADSVHPKSSPKGDPSSVWRGSSLVPSTLALHHTPPSRRNRRIVELDAGDKEIRGRP
jgi:hypothetical protein